MAPGTGHYAAQRAYGAIVSSRGRAEVMRAAGEVFFRSFPDANLESDFSDTMTLYGHAGTRRNEIAHGLLMGGPDRKHPGYYLASSVYNTNKRKIDLTSVYFYSSEEIRYFAKHFQALGTRANQNFRGIEATYFASPEKSRARY